MSEYEKLHARIAQLVKRNDEFELENRELREKLYRAENPEFSGKLDTWQAACGKARGEAETMREELRAIKPDATRYQWLRASDWYVGEGNFYCGKGGSMENYTNENFSPDDLDATIDAAIARDTK